MKFMIAGLGSIGRRHLRHLIALGQEDILLYRSHQGTIEDDELARFPVETDLAKALAHKPDAVIISNPTALHLDVAIPAAEAGCHLLLEKPISNSLERVEEFKQIVEKNNVKVLVGFQFRHHPSLQKIRELLANGEVGRPISFRARWGEYLPDWHPWEDYRKGYSARKDLGGGVVLTLSHPLDYARMLFGEVNEVFAYTGKLGDLELDVEDTAEISLNFEGGVLGSVHLNYNQRPAQHTLDVVCTKGTIRFNQENTELDVYLAEEKTTKQYALPENFDRDDLFQSQMAHFLDIVQGNAKPLCSLDDGIEAQKLAMAVYESAEENKLIRIDRGIN